MRGVEHRLSVLSLGCGDLVQQIQDPELKKAATAFIGQEAMHGREHEEYNEALFAVSKVAPKFERLVGGLLNWGKEKLPPSSRLSATIALEHFTALLAQQVLENEKLTKGQEPHFAAIWYWHALEETEHKAVAYDVWEAAMGRGPRAYLERAGGQLLATAIFWALVTPTFLEVVREQGKLTDFAGWRKFMRYAFGEVGLIRRLVLPWADYFRPNFHPWDHDNRALLEQWKETLTSDEVYVERFLTQPRHIEALDRAGQPIAEPLARFHVQLPVGQARDAFGQRGTADARHLCQILAGMPVAVGQAVDQRQQLGFAQGLCHRRHTIAFSKRCSLPASRRRTFSRCFQITSAAIASVNAPAAENRPAALKQVT